MGQKRIYLVQPQYAVNINGKPQYWLPYSCGCLWAYAKNQPGINDAWDAHFIFKRNNIIETLAEIENPTAMGFSCYVWNEEYNLAIANAVKEKYPDCIIFFGGPNVNQQFLDDNDCIDSIILGEGEKVFHEILETIYAGEPLKPVYHGVRITDLADLPSPYLEGVFDSIIEANPEAFWQATIETNRGCPFSCTFCDWGSLTMAKVKQFVMERIVGELKWIADNRVTYLMCADANFGVFKDRDIEIAKVMRKEFDRSKWFEKANLQYYKNSNRHVLDIAEILGPYQKGLTVSVQSMHDDTLKAIKRDNMRINDIKSLMDMANERNIFTYSELILGMPLETTQTWRTGINELLEQGQHNCIDVWFCQLLKNSEMNNALYREQYGIESVRVKDYYLTYDEGDTVAEYIDIVNKTNTMTTDEIVDAFIYSFMIIRFHIAGYTNIYSRYARSRGISFENYYNNLYEVLWETPIVKEKFEELKLSIKQYLLTNDSEQNVLSKKRNSALQITNGHPVSVKKNTTEEEQVKSKHAWLYMRDIDFVYGVKDQIFEIGFNLLKKLLPDTPSNIKDAQINSVLSEDVEYPLYRDYNIDLKDYSHSDTTKSYIITDDENNMGGNVLFHYRRSGSHLKTIVQELEPQLEEEQLHG